VNVLNTTPETSEKIADRQPRSPQRMPDLQWRTTLLRVRAEFAEMPCMRVTADQARSLFGLGGSASQWILDRLAAEGFLSRTPQGEYVRRGEEP
jgi:hypothetical protein